MRSHPRARDNPAPTANPSTLAMVGLVMWCRDRATSPRRRIRERPDCDASVAGPLGSPRSAPVQNAPPAPVSTMTRSSGLRSTSSKVACSSRSITALAAFFRSGRFMVTLTTPPLRSTMSVSIGSDPRPESFQNAPSITVRVGSEDRHDVKADVVVATGRDGRYAAASWRRRRCLSRVTASTGVPRRSVRLVLTSQTTRTRSRVHRRSISPCDVRQFRSMTRNPRSRYQPAARFSPPVPEAFAEMHTREWSAQLSAVAPEIRGRLLVGFCRSWSGSRGPVRAGVRCSRRGR